MRFARLYSLISVCSCACIIAASFVGDAIGRAYEAVERFARMAIDVLARPTSFATSFGPMAVPAGGAPFGYDAPPQHQLRHEAGTSRRAAPRNI